LRERERDRQTEREREKERESAHVESVIRSAFCDQIGRQREGEREWGGR